MITKEKYIVAVLAVVLGMAVLGGNLTQVAAQKGNTSVAPVERDALHKLVGADVLEDLEGATSQSWRTDEPTSDVLVALTEEAAPGNLGSSEGRAAMRSAMNAIVAELSQDDVQVTYRFFGARGFRANVTRAGLQQLVATGAIARIEDATRLVEVQDGAVDSLIGTDKTRQDGFRGDGIDIAIIDSGINAAHPDLVGAVATDFCLESCDERVNPHGTAVALIAAGRGVVGPIGVAPGARVNSIRVADENGIAQIGAIIRGLDYILSELPEVDVVNISMGTAAFSDVNLDPVYYTGECNKMEDTGYTYNDSGYHLFGFDLVSALSARGTIVVASSGNGSDRAGMSFPACISNVVSVGAMAFDGDYDDWACPSDTPNGPTCYTNFNKNTDVFAPGSVEAADFTGTGTTTGTGTSFAAPLVSGCIAAAKALGQDVAPSQFQALLRSSPNRLVGFENHARLDCPDVIQKIRAGDLPEAVVVSATCYELDLAPLVRIEVDINDAVGGKYEVIAFAEYGPKKWRDSVEVRANSSRRIKFDGRRAGVEHRIVVRRDGKRIFNEVRKFSECMPSPQRTDIVDVHPSCYTLNNGKKYVQLKMRLFGLAPEIDAEVKVVTEGTLPSGESWPTVTRTVRGSYGSVGIVNVMGRPEGHVFRVGADGKRVQSVGPVWCGEPVEVDFGACYTIGTSSYRNVQVDLRNMSDRARTFTATVGGIKKTANLSGSRMGKIVVSGRPAGSRQAIRVSASNSPVFDESVRVPTC